MYVICSGTDFDLVFYDFPENYSKIGKTVILMAFTYVPIAYVLFVSDQA